MKFILFRWISLAKGLRCATSLLPHLLFSVLPTPSVPPTTCPPFPGMALLLFSAVNLVPHGWRIMYIVCPPASTAPKGYPSTQWAFNFAVIFSWGLMLGKNHDGGFCGEKSRSHLHPAGVKGPSLDNFVQFFPPSNFSQILVCVL